MNPFVAHTLIVWVVTAVSLVILSKLPTGIRINSFSTALWSSAVFGLLNAFLKPVLSFFGFPLIFLTLGLFLVVINMVIFGLSAGFVKGFELRWGLASALIGTFGLTAISSGLFFFLERLFPKLTF